jgi:hypothetical protein
MALSKQDIKILEQICAVEGDCMISTRCSICPFRSQCLPEFLNPIPPTTNQRAKMAADILTHHALIDEEVEVQEYRWDKR